MGRDDLSSKTGLGVRRSLTAFSTEPDFGVAVFWAVFALESGLDSGGTDAVFWEDFV